MDLIQVAVSGTVGKQVVATDKVSELCGFTLTPSAANATITIRDGGGAAASGQVVYFGRATSANGSLMGQFSGPRKFTKGLHVTVIGTNAVAYLELN